MPVTDDAARATPARRPVRVASALWLALAAVVWQMRFDWLTRMAAFHFAGAQLSARARGQRVVTIADGFRPEVTAAAWHAATWAVGVGVIGLAAVAWAARTGRRVGRVPPVPVE